MALLGNESRALALKGEADAAYRSQNYSKARDLYTRAAKLHEVPTLRSNLAIAEFELGQYTQSIENSRRAITLLVTNSSESGVALRLKNELRVCRALAITKQTEEALVLLKELDLKLSSSLGLDPLKQNATALLKDLARTVECPMALPTDAQATVLSLPRLRPSLWPEIEYYTVFPSSVTPISEFQIHQCTRICRLDTTGPNLFWAVQELLSQEINPGRTMIAFG